MHVTRSTRTIALLAMSLTAVTAAAADRFSSAVNQVNIEMGLRSSEITSIAVYFEPDEPLLTQVTLGDQTYTLDLHPHSIRSASYRLLVQIDDGPLVDFEPGPVRTFRGGLSEVPGSAVAAFVLNNGLHARILMPDGAELWIEPLSGRIKGASADQHVVYRTDDLIPGAGRCGNEALEAEAFALVNGGSGLPSGLDVALLACDADFEYFQRHGGVSSVETRISGIVHLVNLQYERDVAITHQIEAIVVRSTSNDPYTKKKSRNRLNEFQAEWNTNLASVPRDTAQLFTGIDLAGLTIGEAFDFGVICDVPRSYSIVSDYTSTLACLSDLSAHELGHCWNARHCSCPGFTMNSSITCANRFNTSSTIPVIAAFRDSIDCLGGGTPCSGDGDCDDGNPCTIDTCVGGVCVNTPIDCDDGNPCTQDSCDGNGNCVNTPIDPCGDNAIVECITYTTSGGRGGTKNLNIAVLVVDDFGSPIVDAAVSVSVRFPSGGVGTATGTTNQNGEAIFVARNAADGCYITDVTTINAPGFAFDGSEPVNGHDKGNDSTPDADCIGGSTACGG